MTKIIIKSFQYKVFWDERPVFKTSALGNQTALIAHLTLRNKKKSIAESGQQVLEVLPSNTSTTSTSFLSRIQQ